MKNLFIIDGEPIEIDVQLKEDSTGTYQATPVDSRWHKHKVSSEIKIYIEGYTEGGQQFQGTFRKIGDRDDGTMVLETWTENPKVGGER